MKTIILTLVCWNIQYGQNFEGILWSLTRELPAADVYLLQEVDKGTRRTGYSDTAQVLGDQLKLHRIWSSEFRELAQENGTNKAYTGQATLSRNKIILIKEFQFRHQFNRWSPSLFHPRSWFQPRYGKRMAQIIEMEVQGHRVILINTHLESRISDIRTADQMGDLLDYVDDNFPGRDIILAGDFNTALGAKSLAIKMMEDRGFSCPHRGDKPKLDWIFFRGSGIALNGPSVIRRDIKATDHHPLTAEFYLK